MGLGIETSTAEAAGRIAVTNGRRPVDPRFSIQPESAIRDLRHPIPIHPVSSNPTPNHACSYPLGSRLDWSTGRIAKFLAAPLSRAAFREQRTVVVEDRTDG